MSAIVDRFIADFGDVLDRYNVNQHSTKEDVTKFIMHAQNMGGIDDQEELDAYLEMAENHLDELKVRLEAQPHD